MYLNPEETAFPHHSGGIYPEGGPQKKRSLHLACRRQGGIPGLSLQEKFRA